MMPDDQSAMQSIVYESAITALADDHAILTVPPQSATEERALPAESPASMSLAHQSAVISQMYARASSLNRGSSPGALYRSAKRGMDVTLSLIALIVLSPVFLVVAILVRLDSPGPAIFTQYRVGQNGRVFRMYKFRTMTNGCGINPGPEHKVKHDSRVTRVGKFLRESSIDELPQFLNVLLGQMSLVGPRPELPSVMVARYEPWQYQRLSVPQGLTGWWQVTGRGKKLLWKHTEDDLYYIEQASLWFDVLLLVKTLRAVISRNGAF